MLKHLFAMYGYHVSFCVQLDAKPAGGGLTESGGYLVKGYLCGVVFLFICGCFVWGF